MLIERKQTTVGEGENKAEKQRTLLKASFTTTAGLILFRFSVCYSI